MNLAQFNSTDINNAIAEFGPAQVLVSGKSITDKRINIIKHGSDGVKLFASGFKGKVGAAAREGLQEQGLASITVNARRGNYNPLAEALALITGEAVFISNRASYETLSDRYDAKLADLKGANKLYKKGSDDQYSAKGLQIMQCLSTINVVREGVAAMLAHENQSVGESE